MKTVFYKSSIGWRGESETALSDKMVLRISTSKRHGGQLITIATAWECSPTGMIGHKMFSDFNETVATSKPARVTEAIVQKQHDQCLKSAESIKQRALAFYATRETAAA